MKMFVNVYIIWTIVEGRWLFFWQFEIEHVNSSSNNTIREIVFAGRNNLRSLYGMIDGFFDACFGMLLDLGAHVFQVRILSDNI